MQGHPVSQAVMQGNTDQNAGNTGNTGNTGSKCKMQGIQTILETTAAQTIVVVQMLEIMEVQHRRQVL